MLNLVVTFNCQSEDWRTNVLPFYHIHQVQDICINIVGKHGTLQVET